MLEAAAAAVVAAASGQTLSSEDGQAALAQLMFAKQSVCGMTVDGLCELAEPHVIQQHNPEVQSAAAAGVVNAFPSSLMYSLTLGVTVAPAQAVLTSEAVEHPFALCHAAACCTAEETAADAVRDVENFGGGLCFGEKAELCLDEGH